MRIHTTTKYRSKQEEEHVGVRMLLSLSWAGRPGSPELRTDGGGMAHDAHTQQVAAG